MTEQLTTQVFGHRGASGTHPENTLDAFVAAIDAGASGVELDVRRTRDGHVVVHHDAHLSDGRAIVELGRAELPEAVPGLDEVIALNSDLIVNVEIKSDPRDPDFDPEYVISAQVIAAIESADAARRCMITSFDPAAVDPHASNSAGIGTGWISQQLPDWDRLAEVGHRVFAPWYPLVDATLIAEAGRRGIAVGAWTVNSPSHLRAMSSAGVDFVMTDWPARAIELFSKFQQK